MSRPTVITANIVSGQEGTGAGPLTVALDATGANFILFIIGVGHNPDISSFTYAAQTPSAIGSPSGTGGKVWMYGLVNPTSGSNNISLTLNISDDKALIAIPFSGVNTSNPFGTSVNATFGAVNISQDITATDDQIIVDGVCASPSGGGYSITKHASQTLAASEDVGGSRIVASSYKDGVAGTFNMSWTVVNIGGSSYKVVGVNGITAGGASGGSNKITKGINLGIGRGMNP